MLFEKIVEIIDPDPHAAALNMAIDEALLQTASLPLLRVYRWSRPAVSFGYFGRFDAAATAWPGREMVRRWTGGGVVAHGEDITYTLIVPRASDFFRHAARESYRLIHERIAGYLSRAGRAVGVAAQSSRKLSDACFENPVAFDLLADGMKVAGAAQRRAQRGLLHQGSIRVPGMTPGFSEGLAGVFAPEVAARELRAGELETAQVLAAQKYATDAWLRKF
jgi:lipoate-protein ligase A